MGEVIQVRGHGRLQATTVVILLSTLRQIKDRGDVLYDRINAQGYEECKDDVQTVSGIVEDIQDIVLGYQVGRGKAQTAIV